MKKHTIAIISVILCFAPIYTHARNPGTCPANSCEATPGCGFVGGICTRCAVGTYNEGGLYSEGCKSCLKPEGAEWVDRGDTFIGMESAKECAWEIKCGEDYQIDPDEWNSIDGTISSSTTLSCEPCLEGYYKDANAYQRWEYSTWSSQSGLCQPKTFNIYAIIILPEACGNLEDTANVFVIDAPIITYTADQELKYPFDDVKKVIENDQDLQEGTSNFAKTYTYPNQNTNFKLQPSEFTEGAPSIYVKLDRENNLVFKSTQDYKDAIQYPNNIDFYIYIYMTETNPTYIAYCSSEVKNDSELTDTNCVFETFNKCVPTYKTLSDISFTNTPDCSDGKYVDSWKLLDGAHNYDWTKSTEIKFTDPITLPSSSSEIFYMAPKFQDCDPGTINSNTQCNTTCQKCPDGFGSTTPATQCYLNVPLTDKLGTYTPSETIILQ